MPCVSKNSVEFCGKCQHTEQCTKPHKCCPISRLCIRKCEDDCIGALTAGCKPSCSDHMDQKRCSCQNPDFPLKWGGLTCA